MDMFKEWETGCDCHESDSKMLGLVCLISRQAPIYVPSLKANTFTLVGMKKREEFLFVCFFAYFCFLDKVTYLT